MARQTSFVVGLCLLVAISLYLKVVTVDHAYAAPDDAAFSAELRAELIELGYTTQTRSILGRDAIIARDDACELLAVRLDGRAHGRDRFVIAARGIGTISYIYGGEWHKTFPRVRPLMEEQVWRFLQPLARTQAFKPLIGIARNQSCRLSPDLFSDIVVMPAPA